MAGKKHATRPATPRLGTGQVALEPAEPILAPAEQARNLYRLSDPALSELGLEDLLDELLGRVCELLSVDTVAILLLDPDTNELVARAARGIEEEVEQGVRLPLGQGFAGRIAAERVAIFIADVDHADILNPILREKGIASLLGVPLIVEGDLIGVLHVGSLTPREFTQKDLAVLEMAAARAAPAIERASLFSQFQHEHQVAMLLQRSLLPTTLPHGVGFEVAARYIAAREEVGGDWYDVVELPRGQLGIAIGDVVGHGISAAAMMGQLRTALRAHALEGHRPAQTLERLDRFVQAMETRAMATALYGVFDPETGELCLSSAGHLPPVLLGGDGPRVLEVPPGAPLGGFAYCRYTDHSVTLAGEEMLVLYTDGLVERRGIPIRDKIEELMGLIAEARTPEQACRYAITGLVPDGGLRDDVAILALRSSPVPAELQLELPADPHVLGSVRRIVRRWLHQNDVEDSVVAEVTLATNEASANAVEHAYPPGPATFFLRAAISDGELRITVRDTGSWRSPRGEDRGRGLTIMRSAMDEVDVNRSPDGTEIVMRRRLARG
jgi:anti-sigma regulatory factor (Ser/Thr protein kinase)/putative methionine-R-sulfoxide reductase with GAF domain